MYSGVGNGVPMVAKLVLEVHTLCNKNEISYPKSSQKCNVTNHGFAHVDFRCHALRIHGIWM